MAILLSSTVFHRQCGVTRWPGLGFRTGCRDSEPEACRRSCGSWRAHEKRSRRAPQYPSEPMVATRIGATPACRAETAGDERPLSRAVSRDRLCGKLQGMASGCQQEGESAGKCGSEKEVLAHAYRSSPESIRTLKNLFSRRLPKKVQTQGGAPGTHPQDGCGARRTQPVRRSAARVCRVPICRMGAADGPFSAAC